MADTKEVGAGPPFGRIAKKLPQALAFPLSRRHMVSPEAAYSSFADRCRCSCASVPRFPRRVVNGQVYVFHAADLFKDGTDLFGGCFIAQIAHKEGAAAVCHSVDAGRRPARTTHATGPHEYDFAV